MSEEGEMKSEHVKRVLAHDVHLTDEWIHPDKTRHCLGYQRSIYNGLPREPKLTMGPSSHEISKDFRADALIKKLNEWGRGQPLQ
jgi:hypothetical protein